MVDSVVVELTAVENKLLKGMPRDCNAEVTFIRAHSLGLTSRLTGVVTETASRLEKGQEKFFAIVALSKPPEQVRIVK
jgi:hypothetical protein